MTDKEVYQKIQKITERFDIVQSSIDFYKKEFSDLEDKLEYYSKYSWLPDSTENIRTTINHMKEILSRSEKEQSYFDELEKQLDEVENSL
jgi:predicted RNase H-like nuclease (RuvC/YqgF family)